MENLNIGARCSLNYCNQKDFLPFKCKYCTLVVCQSHFHDHECKHSQADDKRVAVCTRCKQQIRYKGEERDKEVIEEHQQLSVCKQAANQKTKRCPVCTVKLTLVNNHTCKQCGVDTCMKHRSNIDHSCAPANQTKFSWRDLVTAH